MICLTALAKTENATSDAFAYPVIKDNGSMAIIDLLLQLSITLQTRFFSNCAQIGSVCLHVSQRRQQYMKK